ncbi:metallo-beta-lactamase domain [Fusarium albosuccineum]|uniref:Metallo-beta-lactamase domain n=1 Tax=Fusarium albosuccineum TaxID=1237068 RepID=A0A8H4PKG4_9HYPO|nr:metallo-beta-lactamase domain [Fusarium albosuccineum]
MAPTKLRVETRINRGIAQDMVSSLIMGSQAAVLVDVPLTIPQAKELVEWILTQTSLPLVAIFATHFHPDHYLAVHVILESFPQAKFYATGKTVSMIIDIIEGKASDEIVHLLGPVNGDSPEQTMLWIPSIKTLIAGDVVYGHRMHIWLADLDDPLLTKAWLDSLQLIDSLGAERVIPGHSLGNDESFYTTKDVEHTRAYVQFFQNEIEPEPKEGFTPEEIINKFNKAFPDLETGQGSTSQLLLQINAQHFGRGGVRQKHDVDLVSLQKSYGSSWNFKVD